MRTYKETLKQASSIVMQEVMSFWEMARIPTMAVYHVISKVIKEYDRWRILQKGSFQPAASQIEREVKFKDQLNDLFDIAHSFDISLVESIRCMLYPLYWS